MNELGTEHFRDCVRDVLAMVESFLAVQQDDGSAERDAFAHRENLRVLFEHADTGGCLRVAVAMLASSFQMISRARAGHLGTEADAELAGIFAEFRKQLA